MPKTRKPGRPVSLPDRQLYQTWVNRLVPFLRRNIREREHAPDLAHDALVAAIESTDLSTLDNPMGYLLTTAANLAGQKRLAELAEREAITHHVKPGDPLADTQATDSHPPAEPLIFQAALEKAFGKLDLRSRNVLALWFLGCSYREIARRLSIRENRVPRIRAEAMNLLRSLLNSSPSDRM